MTDDKQAEPVSLTLLRSHLRVVADDEDDLIQSWAKTARLMVEEESHVALTRKTIRHRMRRFPQCEFIPLMRWPLVSVEAVKYFDTAGTEITLDESLYRVDLDRRPAGIWRVDTWPATAVRHDAVTIEYTAGFDPNDNPAPEFAAGAILLLCAHWYKNREAVGQVGSEVKIGYERLLNLLHQESYP